MREFGAGSFERYIAVDYSGAQAPTSPLRELRVFEAGRVSPPAEVSPASHPGSARIHWSRRGVAEWLVETLSEPEGGAALVGIRHAFSFPRRYFEQYHLPLDWTAFLDDFQRHWPTDEDGVTVECVQQGIRGNATARRGDSEWRRLTDDRAHFARSVFWFDPKGWFVPATHAGLPWLRYIRQHVKRQVHFWPFDGWQVPAGRSVVAEVCPRLWDPVWRLKGQPHETVGSRFMVAWMQDADADGRLEALFSPRLDRAERATAGIEGWILGVH